MSADWDAAPSWSCTGPVGVRTVKSVPREEDDDDAPPSLRSGYCNKGKDVAKRLKPRKWKAAFDYEGRPVGFHRLLKSIALGGVDHSIRAEVWEFLLGCYGLGTTAEYRQGLRAARRERYRRLVEQCHEMHSSIGTGNLAYTVGSKVMDARLTTRKGKEVTNLEPQADQEETVERRGMGTSPRVTSPRNKLSMFDEDFKRSTPSLSPGFDCVYKSSCEDPENRGVPESSADSELGLLLSPTRTLSKGGPNLKLVDEYPLASSGGDCSTSSKDSNTGITEATTYLKPKGPVSIDVGLFSFSAGSMKRINSWLLRDRRKKDRGLKIRDSAGVFAEDERHKHRSGQLESQADLECGSLHEPVAALGRSASGERIAEWLWMLHRIVVDVVRTDRHLDFYGDAKNMARMSDILAVYAWVDPKTGYCQGMSDLLSPFIVIFEDDADAFWCFESLFKRVRQNFQMEGPVGVMKQLEALSKILEVTDPQMSKHLAVVGADNFLFAFRMLLVLFRREVSFGESLCMWEMMWAADFNQAMALSLDFNCLEALVLRLSPPGFLLKSGRSDDNSCSRPFSFSSQSDSSPSHEFSMDSSIPNSGALGVNFLGRGPLCGLRPGGLLLKNRHKLPLVSTLLERNGDEELSVFCVAAILVQNRNKLLREIHSMDDAIKTFNEMKLVIQVHNSVHAAMKLRRKYRNQLTKHPSPEKEQTQI